MATLDDDCTDDPSVVLGTALSAAALAGALSVLEERDENDDDEEEVVVVVLETGVFLTCLRGGVLEITIRLASPFFLLDVF
jgi:hypothetical protein